MQAGYAGRPSLNPWPGGSYTNTRRSRASSRPSRAYIHDAQPKPGTMTSGLPCPRIQAWVLSPRTGRYEA
ncbi:hypothetical protein GCM10008937_31090 [Deinococcus depolymerans]|uniref:Uncharacterized protein n=1 Tax=Deinococcus depolymerans TaxID=392408 RepID=A0ABN1CL15_9DEIO